MHLTNIEVVHIVGDLAKKIVKKRRAVATKFVSPLDLVEIEFANLQGRGAAQHAKVSVFDISGLTSSCSLFVGWRQNMSLSKSAEIDVDVVIDGVGWCSMAAADHLLKIGVSFVVSEVQNYIGGRTHSLEFGEVHHKQRIAMVGDAFRHVGSRCADEHGCARAPCDKRAASRRLRSHMVNIIDDNLTAK